jgi:glycosyltransferase involved in cell wall biosynthesis
MKDLSVIIACYNEEDVLEENMKKITSLLDRTRYDYEIILIDDKSRDGTAEIIKKLVKGSKRISGHFHRKNMGRGATVKEGIMLAAGKVAGYIDIDLEVPAENIISHALAIESGYDVAYADRITRVSITNFHRQIMHSVYILLSKAILGTGFNDTNAGCKFFNRKRIMPVLEKTKDPHWFWDTEILARSRKAGLKMKEIPALYITNRKSRSTVKVFSDTVYFIRKMIEFSREEKIRQRP